MLITSLVAPAGETGHDVQIPPSPRHSHFARRAPRAAPPELEASIATSFPRWGAHLVTAAGALSLLGALGVSTVESVAQRFGVEPALTAASMVITGIALIALGVLASRGSALAMAAATGVWVVDALTTLLFAGGHAGAPWVFAKLVVAAVFVRTVLAMGLTLRVPTGRARVPALAAGIVAGVFTVITLFVLAPRLRAAASLGVSDEAPLGDVDHLRRRLIAAEMVQSSHPGEEPQVWSGRDRATVTVQADAAGAIESIDVRLLAPDPELEGLFAEEWRKATLFDPTFTGGPGDERAEAATPALQASWVRTGAGSTVAFRRRDAR